MVNFQNEITPINDTNLNKMQTDLQKKVLWENSNPSSAFLEQDVTLNSTDYDYLIIFSYRNYALDVNRTICTILEKGKATEIVYSDYLGEIRTWNRQISSNGLTVHFGTAYINGISSSTNDGTLIPYKILGGKYE